MIYTFPTHLGLRRINFTIPGSRCNCSMHIINPCCIFMSAYITTIIYNFIHGVRKLEYCGKENCAGFWQGDSIVISICSLVQTGDLIHIIMWCATLIMLVMLFFLSVSDMDGVVSVFRAGIHWMFVYRDSTHVAGTYSRQGAPTWRSDSTTCNLTTNIKQEQLRCDLPLKFRAIYFW